MLNGSFVVSLVVGDWCTSVDLWRERVSCSSAVFSILAFFLRGEAKPKQWDLLIEPAPLHCFTFAHWRKYSFLNLWSFCESYRCPFHSAWTRCCCVSYEWCFVDNGRWECRCVVHRRVQTSDLGHELYLVRLTDFNTQTFSRLSSRIKKSLKYHWWTTQSETCS